jgi:hypothetical protein
LHLSLDFAENEGDMIVTHFSQDTVIAPDSPGRMLPGR